MKRIILLVSFMLAAPASLFAQQTNYTVTIPPGYKIIANQLVSSNMTVPVLFRGVPDGTRILKWSAAAAAYTVNVFDQEFQEWSDPDETLVPGEGAFIFNPTTTNLPVTFTGQIWQGSLTNTFWIPHGYSLISRRSFLDHSSLPVSSLPPGCSNGRVLQWIRGGFFASTYDVDFGWDVEPVIGVGEGFFYFNPCAAFVWRTSPGP